MASSGYHEACIQLLCGWLSRRIRTVCRLAEEGWVWLKTRIAYDRTYSYNG